jgi:2-isopropylmalate synthase
MKDLIMRIEARSAEEITKHTKGPGTRYVISDHNNNPDGNVYVAIRMVENMDRPEIHVEPHQHDFESMFIFKGAKPDMSGLVVEILLGDTRYQIESPKAVRIPARMSHNYRFISGSGEMWNIVLTPGADYNKTAR